MSKYGYLIGVALAGLLVHGPAQADDVPGDYHSTGPSGNVSDLIGDLYGGDGITLDPGIVFHEAHFTADSQDALSDLSNIIGANVGVIAFNSSVSAISFDIEEGVPVRSRESLGPLIAERATTIGGNKINVGVSYTRVNYRQFNGQKLDQLTLDLAHDQEFGAPYEDDIVQLNIDLDLQQEFITFITTYGVTDSLDVSIVVPLVSVDGSVRAEAVVIDNGGGGIHTFGGAVSPVSTNSASATGLGDLLVRAKWHLTDERDSILDLGVVAQASLATGDEKDLLGSGSNAVYVGAIASANLGKINPHINVGYEHYTDQTKTSGVDIDRSNVRAIAGFDIRARENLALATEVLGRWRSDGTSLYDIATGVKWAPVGDVPISANLVVPLNRNEGLRPDYYFTLGIEGTF